MGNQVAVLRAGRLVQTAAPEELYRTPADLEVAEFVGEAVVLSGEVSSGTVNCDLGRLAVRGATEEGSVRVMIRPEQIRVNGTGDGVPATVVGRSFFGPETVLRLELATGVHVSARVLGDSTPADRSQVWLDVDGPVSVFPA
jgi:iron(III) transport system ATP-binding protein